MESKDDQKKLERWAKLIQRASRDGNDLTVEESLNRAGIDDLKSELSTGGTMGEQFVEWLLSEAEYCSHMILIANGNVLMHSSDRQSEGVLMIGYLWAQTGHTSLLEMENPVEFARRRLRNAIKAMRLIMECRTIPTFPSWSQRSAKILAMTTGDAGDDMKAITTILDRSAEFTFGQLKIRTFGEAMANEGSRKDLYLHGFMETMHRLLNKMTGIRWDLDLFGDGLQSCSLDKVLSIVDNIPTVKAVPEKTLSEFYFRLFRVAFGRLALPKKLRVMMYVFEKYGPVMWHMHDQHFERDLPKVAMKMLAKEQPIIDLASEASWFFMISLKYTWWRLMLVASRQRAIIPALIQMLHNLAPVTSLRYGENTPRIFLQCSLGLLTESHIFNKEIESNLVQLLCNLMIGKERLNPDGSLSSIKPIVDTTEAVATLIMPLMEFSPRLAMSLLLEIVDPNYRKVQCVKWSCDAPTDGMDDLGENGISIAKLICMIVEAVVNSKKREEKKFGLVTLHLLLTDWKDDPRLTAMTPSVQEWLKDRLDNVPWLIRCFVYRDLQFWIWNQEPLPTCLVRMFDLADSGFKGVECDHGQLNGDNQYIQCAFTSLLQLAQLSIVLAKDVLKSAKFSILIANMHLGQLAEPMIGALVQVLGESDTFEDWLNCNHLLTSFCDRLWDEQESFFKNLFKLESMSIGTRAVAPVVKLCDAMDVMLSKARGQTAHSYLRNLSAIINLTVQERVQTMDNPLAKLFAYILLHLLVTQLVTKTKESDSTADVDKLEAMVRALEDEMAKARESTSMAACELLGFKIEFASDLMKW